VVAGAAVDAGAAVLAGAVVLAGAPVLAAGSVPAGTDDAPGAVVDAGSLDEPPVRAWPGTEELALAASASAGSGAAAARTALQSPTVTRRRRIGGTG
jgi:hypothetical protein